MIASVISSPRASSENSLISERMNAEISSGLYSRPRARIFTSPLTARTISYGSTSRAWGVSSASNLRPTSRLTAKTVFIGFVIDCRLAICPTRRSPSSVKPTIDGVVRLPSRLFSTCGVAPSTTETQQFVVPRSMPRILPKRCLLLRVRLRRALGGVVGPNRDLDERRADEPGVQEIPLLGLPDGGVGGNGVRFLRCNGLMEIRIESARGVDRDQAIPLPELTQL